MPFGFSFVHSENKPKGAVLLFHGLTGSPFELKKYGQFLYNNGYDVFSESLPGHGEKFEEIYTVSYKDWLSFTRSEVLKLKQKYDNIFVSGLCLGAVLAIYAGIEFEPDIKGVISLSTTLFLDGWRLPFYSFLLPVGLSTILRFYYNYPECEPHGIKNEKTRSVIKKLLEKGDVGMNDFPMTGIYELIKLSKAVRKKINKLNVPVLLIHSLEDDLTSTKSAEFVYKKANSKDKEFIVLKNSYHMVLYDNEKEFVFNKTLEFLNNRISIPSKKEALCI